MKLKIVIVALLAVSVALLIALFASKKQSEEQQRSDLSRISDYSNQVVNATLKVTDINQVNLVLSNALLSSQRQLSNLSNNLVVLNGSLAEARASLGQAQTQISTLNTQVSDLEAQNKTLDQRALVLTGDIEQLNLLIAETQAKLALSQGNNTYLQEELQRQMAAKAELEHKFNDLEAVRAQVKKLKSDAFVARRIQFMKNSNADKKGAELLMSPNRPTPAVTASSNYDLNVEIGSDGSVRVIPPMGGATNAPAR